MNSRWKELITKSSTEFGIKHYSTVNRLDVSQYMHVWLVQVTLLNMQMRWASVWIHFWFASRLIKKINEMTWVIVHCFERRGSWNQVYMFWTCVSARKSSLTTRLFPGARRVKFHAREGSWTRPLGPTAFLRVHCTGRVFDRCQKFVRLGVSFTWNHAKRTKIWTLKRSRIWTPKSRTNFLPVQS